MAIPRNIEKEHLLKAIEKIDNEGVPADGDSRYYDVFFNGKIYPPKLVVSYANIFANGSEIDRNSFEGGLKTESFKLLQKNGFIIRNKQLSHFLLGANWSGDPKPDQTDRFLESGIWQNGYEEKFSNIVNSVKKGDRVAIKSSYATKENKSMLRIKATGTVVENMMDGRTLKIDWDGRFSPYDLEGLGGYRNTIEQVLEKDIYTIFKLNDSMNYFPELLQFLEQSRASELGTKKYRKEYQGLNVSVSFGQGNPARIPWIAFLNGIDTVQKGIYPAYLHYRDKNLLILAYGISETNLPNRTWNITDVKSIEEYFAEHNLGIPERYKSSFVFKAYDLNKELDEVTIDNDLNEILSVYKKSYNSPKVTKQFNIQFFKDAVVNAGLYINDITLKRFVASLLTKPFLILTGLAGSGKTKLAQAFAQWICANKTQYKIIPVGADWTNREPLLGYPNALKTGEYVKPDNGVLDLIITANNNPDKPHFLILDEMNLSHVERYFADFLSVMESSEEIPLFAEGQIQNGVPAKLKLPTNIFIIGTVNIDETTNMFSPKVLDRANTIEFRVMEEDMKEFLGNISAINMEAINAKGVDMAESFLSMANSKAISKADSEEINDTLLKFFYALKKAGAEFGYRSASEILQLLNQLSKIDGELSTNSKLDIAIIQKLLPKLHGSRRKLCPVLEILGSLCLAGEEYSIVKDVFEKENYDFNNSNVLYPITLEKITRLYRGAIDNGFASFAEA